MILCVNVWKQSVGGIEWQLSFIKVQMNMIFQNCFFNARSFSGRDVENTDNLLLENIILHNPDCRRPLPSLYYVRPQCPNCEFLR